MKRFILFSGLFVFLFLTFSCKNNPTTPEQPKVTTTSVTVTSPHSTILVGQTEQMTATVTMSDGTSKTATGTWGSDNTAVATVNQSGLVTGISPGDATIYIDTTGIKNLDATDSTNDTTGTKSIDATGGERGTKKQVETGDLRAIKEFREARGLRGTKRLTVQALTVTSVTVTSPNSTIRVGQTEQMTATVTWSDGSTKAGVGTWGSDSPGVATVNQSGMVTGISPADATIYFDTKDTTNLEATGDVRGTKNFGATALMRGTKRLTVRNIWSKSGKGATVFDMPTYVKRVKITGTYTGTGENFVVWIGRDLVVNEILGTWWGQTYYEGTFITSGGVVEVKYSNGLSWTFTEVPTTTAITNTARKIPNFTGQSISGNREYEIYKRVSEGRR